MKYDFTLEVCYRHGNKEFCKKSKCRTVENCRKSAMQRVRNKFTGKNVSCYRIFDENGNIVESKNFISEPVFTPRYVVASVIYTDPLGNTFENIHKYFCESEEKFEYTIKKLKSCENCEILSDE